MKHVLQTLRRLLPYLPADARRFLVGFSMWTALLSGIDVLALMLLALTLTAAITSSPISLPLLGAVSSDAVPWMILVLSLVVIAKSAINVWLQWIATRRFASYELDIGQRLFASYIRAPWTERLRRNTAQIVQMSDTGIANVVAGFLLPITTLPGMFVTGVGVLLVILIAQPVTAVVAIGYLGTIAALQFLVLGGHTRRAARVARDSALQVAALISGMVASMKEITLRDKADEVEAVVRTTRARTAQARANASFLAVVPRFVFDAAIIGGFVLAGGVAFLVGGIEQAVSAVALFGIAGFRLVPSLTGFQNVVTRTITSGHYVDAVITDIDSAQGYLRDQEQLGNALLPDTPQKLHLSEVSFTFPQSSTPAVARVNVEIALGTTVGIAGASGAGKSTLVDLLLGLLQPTSGEISLDGLRLNDVLKAWRSQVGYVPQDVTLFDGTVAQNIALSWGDDVDRDRAEQAARRAQLWPVLTQRSEGLDTRVGERGLSLSGGQRQRLGIARALYTDPLVLVLDEATSALDTKTESDVASAIKELHGDVTVIAVAHRLSTIRDADQILFMRHGEIVACGTFDDVVAENSEFANQARLTGLA